MAHLDLASGSRADLLVTIRDLRERTDAYLRVACSRRRLLVNVSLVAAALAMFLTAAPALGGQSVTKWLGGVFGLTAPAWQLLCAGAALCSLTTTIATQLLKSHNVDEHVVAAQKVRAQLHALEIRAGLDQVGPAEAVAELVKCVEGAAFVWPSSRSARATGRATVRPAVAPCGCASAPGSSQAPAAVDAARQPEVHAST